MALFPDDPLVTVTTPDGRVVQLPSSVAAQFSGSLQSAPQQQMSATEYPLAGMVAGTMGPSGQPPAPPPPPTPPPPQKIGPAPGATSMPFGGEIGAAPQAGASVQDPGISTRPPPMPVDPTLFPPEPAGTGGVPSFSPSELANLGPNGAPQPKTVPQLTTQGLRDMGPAGAANATNNAIEEEIKAGQAHADAEVKQQLAFADAYELRNQKNDDLLAKRAADSQKSQDAIDARMADYDAAVKQYANTKIDRSDDHPIMSAIGMILGAIGGAMQKSNDNPTIKLVQDQIERKVQGQMADKAGLAQVIGMKRSDIDMLRTRATDRTAQYNLMISGETEKAARQMEAIGARSSSDIVRANAAQGAALLRQKAAEATGSAVMAQQGKDERDRAYVESLRHTKVEEKNQAQQTGIAYGHLALAGRADSRADKTLSESIREHDLARQDKLDELALGYAKLGEHDKAAQAKAVAEKGIFDPTTGAAILTPTGQKIVDQADAIEKRARTAPAEQQPAMLAQAKNLRDQAEAVGGFTIEDKEIRKDVIKKVGASQSMIDTIEKIKATLATDPSSINRDAWASLETEFEGSKAAFIEAHGAKMSSREMAAVHDMFGASPGDMATRVGGRSKMLARLNALEQGAISTTTTELRSNGHKGEWRPRALTTDDVQPLQGETSVERGANAELGSVGKRLSFTSNTDRELKAENAGDVTPTGLTSTDTDLVRKSAHRYDAPDVTDDQRKKILTQFQAYAASPRESLSNGVLGLLKGENPALYDQVIASLPKNRQDELGASPEAQAHVLAVTPIQSLTQSAIAGDKDSRSELARRASRGDKLAGRAILDVINAPQPRAR